MRGAPLPHGLKERLLEVVKNGRITVATSVVRDPDARPAAAPQSVARYPSNKRARTGMRWSRAAAVLAGCLVLGLGLFTFVERSRVRLELSELRLQIPLEFDELPNFEGRFTPDKPSNGWNSDRIIFSEPKGIWPDAWGNYQVALYEFQFPGANSYCLLMVVPRGEVEQADLPTFFDASQADYVNHESGRFDTVTWADDDFVYICFVPSGRAMLESLEAALHGTTA